jgi:hypothetical protein
VERRRQRQMCIRDRFWLIRIIFPSNKCAGTTSGLLGFLLTFSKSASQLTLNMLKLRMDTNKIDIFFIISI